MATRFDVLMSPVLAPRRDREERLRADLGEALRALARQEERAGAAEAGVEAELAALRALIDDAPRLHEPRGRHGDLTIARARAAHERAEALRLEAVAIACRAELVRAGDDREALEALRGRTAAGRRLDQGDMRMDELAVRRARRRRGGVAA